MQITKPQLIFGTSDGIGLRAVLAAKMLTLYYVSATVLQSWRIQKACSKIAEHLAQPSSIAFYALQAGSDDGFGESRIPGDLLKL